MRGTAVATINSSQHSSSERSGSSGRSCSASEASASTAASAERPPDAIAQRPSVDAASARTIGSPAEVRAECRCSSAASNCIEATSNRTELGQDLRTLPFSRGFGKRSAQARSRCARSAAPRRDAGGRSEHLDPTLIPRGGSQQEMRGHALRRSALLRQRFGCRRVPRLALPGREILVQRRTNDRMNKPQALDARRRCQPGRGHPPPRGRRLRSDPTRDRRAAARCHLQARRPPSPARSPQGRVWQVDAGQSGSRRPDRPPAPRSPRRADGTTPAASRALSSSRRNRGLPPVAL